MRDENELRPTRLHLVRDIAKYAEIFPPEKSEPPVLAPGIRRATHAWLVELGAADELAEIGLPPRRRALLSGPPGCGKTTLAHHVAARLGLPLAVVSMQALVSKWVGQSGEQIRAFFDAAGERAAELVVFLDEFDAVGVRRMSQESSAAHEKNAVVIAILQQMDRFPGMLLAATNRAEAIDPAVWRRFQIHLDVGLPDDDARFAILMRYLAPLKLPEDDLSLLAALTEGATPALIKELMEGVRREIVLAPRFQRDVADPRAVFARLTAALRPHEEAGLPPLWQRDGIAALKDMAWPPERSER